ncbi:MAG TPA: SMC-Scp complex subunit ScpB [Polyangia bacterium]|jgi:segregation and condensation protein B
MKRKKKDGSGAPGPEPRSEAEDVTPAVGTEADWDGPTRAGEESELADLAAESVRLDAESTSEDALATAADAAGPEGEGPEGESPEGESPEGESPEGEGPEGEGPEGESPEGESPEGESLDAAAAAEELTDLPEPLVDSASRLESILESLLYAADRPLNVPELKRLVNERDGTKVTMALEALRERHAETGIQLASLAGGWQFRTHPDNGPWVAKLVAGRPQRLSRAMLEALAIVAYRQPITRPEIDEIRGVDCGPVLKTLLDRGFVRILGKKEDVGRPMLYGTTPDFLRTFSLRDLSELPTLREFHELSEQQMASVDAQAPLPEGAPATDAVPERSPFAPAPIDLAPVDKDEEDELLEELDGATLAAARAAGPPPGQGADAAAPDAPEAQS